MPLSFRLRAAVGALVLMGLAAARMPAQSSWTSVVSPTTQALRGVCYGAKQFVAVGDQGTILTSPDGLVWTMRTSGTGSDLLAVAASTAGYVAVGTQGTILGSADGVTWNSTTAGQDVLRGVAYKNGHYMAIGDGAVYLSNDARTWTAASAVVPPLASVTASDAGFATVTVATNARPNVYIFNLDGTVVGSSTTTGLYPGASAIASDGPTLVTAGMSLYSAEATLPLTWRSYGRIVPSMEGVGFFNNSFVAVGPNLIFYGEPHGTKSYQAFNIPNANLHAVATDGSVAIAVGDSGAIIRSLADKAPPLPYLVAGGSSLTVPTGGTTTLTAYSEGSLPLRFQWNFNGQPIVGATSSSLTLSDAQPSQSGHYTVTVSNDYGSATSDAYIVAVSNVYDLHGFTVDTAFVASLTKAPALTLLQPDGKLVIAADNSTGTIGNFPVNGHTEIGVARLNRDGSIDSSFDAGSAISPTWKIIQLLRQPDGKIVIAGTDLSPPGPFLASVVRLNANGTLDSAFNFSSDPDQGPGYLVPIASGALASIGLTSPDPSSFPAGSVPPLEIQVRRHGANGETVDVDTLSLARPDGFTHFFPFSAGSFTTDGYGRIYVAFSVYPSRLTPAQSCVIRLNSDGTIDRGYVPAWLGFSISRLTWCAGKIGYDTGQDGYAPGGLPVTHTFGKLNEDGSIDASFPVLRLSNSGTPTALYRSGTFEADGGLIVMDYLRGLVRYDPTGKIDRAFAAFLDTNGLLITDVNEFANGDLVVSGSFASLNGVHTSGLARILPDREAYVTRLSNFSIRSTVDSGDRSLIAGFIVNGDTARTVLMRGIGPTLANFGVSNPAQDPRLDFYADQTFVKSNDNWDASLSNVFTSVSAFPLPNGSKDAALTATLNVGNYSAIIANAGSSNGSRVALAEIYDLGTPPPNASACRLTNISARTFVGTGENVLIAGFIVTGPGVKRFLIRAVGPALTTYGVSGVLADPKLQLFAGAVEIASNDSWSTNSVDGYAATVAATETGAFALSQKDAALVVNLPAGVYSAQVSGVDNTTGVALVEVYELP